jgi:hypothetical protein
MLATRNGAIGIPGEYMWAIRSALNSKKNAELYHKISSGKEMLSLWGFVTTLFEGAFDNHVNYFYLTDNDINKLKEAMSYSLQQDELTANQALCLGGAIRYFDNQ